MSALDSFRQLLMARAPAIILLHDPALTPESVSASIRATLSEPATVIRLRSDTINPEDASVIREALLSGYVLLLIVGDGNKLAEELVRAWQYFCAEPRRSSPVAGRFIHFKEEDAKHPLGTLCLVLPMIDRPLPRVRGVPRIIFNQLETLDIPPPLLDAPIARLKQCASITL